MFYATTVAELLLNLKWRQNGNTPSYNRVFPLDWKRQKSQLRLIKGVGERQSVAFLAQVLTWSGSAVWSQPASRATLVDASTRSQLVPHHEWTLPIEETLMKSSLRQNQLLMPSKVANHQLECVLVDGRCTFGVTVLGRCCRHVTSWWEKESRTEDCSACLFMH